MSDGLARLGKEVAARRHALGLSYAQVQKRGGPSDTRMSGIENSTGPAPRASTLQKIDLALNWTPGSAQAVLDGGDPTPTPASSAAAARDSSMSLGEGHFAVSNNEIAQIVASLRRLDHEFQTAGNAVIADPNLHGAYLNHTAVVSTIVGHWVTNLLERNVEPGQPLPPMLELALGPYLDAEVVHDRSDLDEQLYRRWLAGREVKLTAAQRAAFTARHERATRVN